MKPKIVPGPGNPANRLRTNIDRVFDALFVPNDPDAPAPDHECYLCEKTSAEGCRCWVRLRCANCDDTITVQRVVAEDGDDDEVVTICPTCAPKPAPESEPPPSPRSA